MRSLWWFSVFFCLLLTTAKANVFEDADENEETEVLPDLRRSHRSFHARVRGDESDTGFSYKVERHRDGETEHEIRHAPKTPYSASRDTARAADDKQIITGIPDLSDPCFRRYANSIIVNAQPYERRSSISLASCKTQCLQSQIGIYSCHSFVYDNVNQVCDLFAHVGDQAPARLLFFKTRDYFEPTAAIACNPDALLQLTTTTPSIPAAPPIQAATTTLLKEQSTPTDSFASENSVIQPLTPPLTPMSSCANGKVARFLKTLDFELHNADDDVIDSVTLEDCINFCTSNTAANGSVIKCNSFEYSNTSRCILSTETAVPLGNGQLKQQPGTDYYEKVCVDEILTNECPSIYNRHPQMILVGFAETVVDAPSLQQCFDNCLNSKKLYGFKCISGMYYFEEPQLNCILNTEDRFTQPDLFTSESADLVDYFETGCNISLNGAERRFAKPKTPSASTEESEFSLKRQDFVDDVTEFRFGWSEWSSCGEASAIQQRTKICAQGRICGQESRECSGTQKSVPGPGSRLPIQPSQRQILEALQKAKCPVDTCCPLFGGCQVGVIQRTSSRRLEWCADPCPKTKAARLA